VQGAPGQTASTAQGLPSYIFVYNISNIIAWHNVMFISESGYFNQEPVVFTPVLLSISP